MQDTQALDQGDHDGRSTPLDIIVRVVDPQAWE